MPTNLTNLPSVPLFHDPEFLNLGAKNKKPATILVHLWLDAKNLVFTNQAQSKRQVLGYRSPDTGLFVTNLKNGEPNLDMPYRTFRLAAVKYATDAVYDKLEALKQIHDNDANTYQDMYKPLDQIKSELTKYLTFRSDFYTQLQKEIDLLVLTPLPHVNEYVLYQDDALNPNQFQTKRLPYLNPTKQKVTAHETELVQKFMDVFADEYNANTIAWYFGAILSNVDLQDDRVSKVLVATSSNGGTGKSTLFEALANGLLTKDYRVIDSGFDKHFRANDKFNTSDLPTCRLGIYSEAYFNADTTGDLDHDFTGLDESEMKSWITDGYVANEQKYADKQISQLTGLQIILTNHPPKIDTKRTDLTRRFLSVVIRPSRMVDEKATALDLYSAHAIQKFVEEHAQAFANYFVHVFKTNPKQYQNVDYDYSNLQEELRDTDSSYIHAKSKSTQDLKTAQLPVVIDILGKQYHLDVKPLLHYLQDTDQAQKDGNLYIEEKHILFNSTKKFFSEFHILPLRSVFKTIYGDTEKAHHQRMFRIPRNQS